MSEHIKVLSDFVDRSTHWRAGGATRHDAVQALANLKHEETLRELQTGWTPEQIASGAPGSNPLQTLARAAVSGLRLMTVPPHLRDRFCVRDDGTLWRYNPNVGTSPSIVNFDAQGMEIK